MSAYLVSRAHLGAIIAAAVHGPSDDARPRYPGSAWSAPYWPGPVRSSDWARIGRALWEENVRSMSARYPDGWGVRAYQDAAAAGILEVDATYPAPVRIPTAVEALKLADCLEYQSCEHPGWATSDARAFLDAFRGAMVRSLAGYDAAPWEWPAEDAA